MGYVFDIDWFKKHQSKILWFVNHWFYPIRIWGRWILRIRPWDCGINEDIMEVEPNNYKVLLPNGQIRADFRTHNKYSKRLFHAFKYVWYVLHFLDMLKIPKLAFGFDTLTVYPDASPGTNSLDGDIDNTVSNKSWSVIHDATAGTTQQVTSTTVRIFEIRGGTNNNRWNVLRRGYFFFYTAALSGGTVTAATLSLYGYTKTDTGSYAPTLNIYGTTSTSTTTLALADFATCGTTAMCDTAITYANFSTSAYNDFALNSTGIANISTTGLSRFTGRNANYDAPNSAPTYTGATYTLEESYSADYTGTGNDPKLVITYTPAGGARRIFVT